MKMIPGLFCATLYNLVKVNSGPTMTMQCNSSEEAKMAWAIDSQNGTAVAGYRLNHHDSSTIYKQTQHNY